MKLRRYVLSFVKQKVLGTWRPNEWFRMDPLVKMLWVPSLAPRYIPRSDVIVATAWQTAERVASYSMEKGQKIYLIQHLETWAGPSDRVMATWKAALRKVVISRWLQAIAVKLDEDATYIPNGLDTEAFGLDNPSQSREPSSVGMLYQQADWKGSADGLAALALVRNKVPGLRVALFGVPSRPPHLPSWIRYTQTPTQEALRALYNDVAIFLAPSWEEGWGLPPSEAMLCGAALAATDIGGHREFAQHKVTALLSPRKDPDALALNVLQLVRDPELRIAIAHKGNEAIQAFTWERAVDAFEGVLLEARSQPSAYNERRGCLK